MKFPFHNVLLILAVIIFSGAAQAGSLGERLQQALSGEQSSMDEILPPEEAFYFTYELQGANTLQLSWDIEYGYYLYQHRFQFESLTPGLSFGDYSLPGGEQKDDPAFGLVTVNKDRVDIAVPLILTQSGAQTIQLKVHYQGCKEGSVCYPPQEQALTLAVANDASSGNASHSVRPGKISEQDAILQRLSTGNVITNIGLFFVFGLLLSLTPCVFPMIPILSGIIVGQGASVTAWRGFWLALVYVVAMALTYAALGVIAAYFGINLQAASQNIGVMLLFSGLFVLLALSMFGFYELQLPASWQSAFNRWSAQQGSGSFLGAAGDGCFFSRYCWPLCGTASGRCVALHQSNRRCCIGWFGLVCYGHGVLVCRYW